MISQPDPALVLRDIHEVPPPPFWPPAPGWWIVAALVLLALLAMAWRIWRRRRRRGQVARLFDETVSQADAPAARLAAMSTLLRRAARQRDPRAATLEGQAWLDFLDEGNSPLFADEDARWLLEGSYRPDADPDAVARLLPRVRARFLEWTAP